MNIKRFWKPRLGLGKDRGAEKNYFQVSWIYRFHEVLKLFRLTFKKSLKSSFLSTKVIDLENFRKRIFLKVNIALLIFYETDFFLCLIPGTHRILHYGW